jgi:hypothetical protein
VTVFARLAALDCPPHADLALALAAELYGVEAVLALSELDALGDGMAAARGRSPAEQLAECGRETAARIAARVRPGEVDDLRLDRVLAQGLGDPVCWAIACVAGAERAGIPLGIVADEDAHVLVAHRELAVRLVVEPQAPDAPIAAARLPAGDLTWRCGHETALMLLDRMVARATRAGRLDDAVRAADLRLALPLDDTTLDRLRAERDRLGARLN